MNLSKTPFEADRGCMSGTLAFQTKFVNLEKERISDLFGAAGNLHMAVFELLFKHSRHLCSLRQEIKKAILAESVIDQCLSNFKVKCYRFLALEKLLAGQVSTSKVEEPAEVEDTFNQVSFSVFFDIH